MPKHTVCPEQNEIEVYPGCSYNCIYCIGRGKDTSSNRIDVNNLTASLNAFIKDLPFYISPLSDAYPPEEELKRYTHIILKYLYLQNRSYFVITKSPLVYRDIDFFRNKKDAFIAVSLNTLDNDVLKLFEPGLPSLDERKELILNIIKEKDVKLVIKIDPVIPGITDGDRLADMLQWIKTIKPYAITCDTLRLSTGLFSNMSRYLPCNMLRTIKAYYKELDNQPRHPDPVYRLNLLRAVGTFFRHTAVKACFCRSLPERINGNDCRGGFEK